MTEDVREVGVGVETVNGSALDAVREELERGIETEDKNGDDEDEGRSSREGGIMPSSVYK